MYLSLRYMYFSNVLFVILHLLLVLKFISCSYKSIVNKSNQQQGITMHSYTFTY